MNRAILRSEQRAMARAQGIMIGLMEQYVSDQGIQREELVEKIKAEPAIGESFFTQAIELMAPSTRPLFINANPKIHWPSALRGEYMSKP